MKNLIVSGSSDKKIKFWQKENQWAFSQTITDLNSTVYALSLNESQNKLISCVWDYLIMVMEQSEQNKYWTVIQKIAVKIKGCRLCFIDNNTFAFQPFEKEYVHIYEMSNTNKQFTKTKDIPVEGGQDYNFFPQQFIKSKCMLVNKNGSNVSLIRIKSNFEFIIQQSIDFRTHFAFGYMTDDGQYLVTWDDNSKELDQIILRIMSQMFIQYLSYICFKFLTQHQISNRCKDCNNYLPGYNNHFFMFLNLITFIINCMIQQQLFINQLFKKTMVF
ncbi:unnamed protein product [Paramecium octaurelia]|uniref:Uncharacterized protein n=1 Tax=Paramecium octaurelia TaxID=43137 RepID=A0A8S1SE93_PAROT|nr:unnamed protein product [Paramecium octaurelia]